MSDLPYMSEVSKGTPSLINTRKTLLLPIQAASRNAIFLFLLNKAVVASLVINSFSSSSCWKPYVRVLMNYSGWDTEVPTYQYFGF